MSLLSLRMTDTDVSWCDGYLINDLVLVGIFPSKRISYHISKPNLVLLLQGDTTMTEGRACRFSVLWDLADKLSQLILVAARSTLHSTSVREMA